MKKENKVLDFIITTMNGMAYGLFATLIVGTIFGTIAKIFTAWPDNNVCKFLYESIFGLSKILSCLTGAGIGVGVALALKLDPLKVIVLAAVGATAGFFSTTVNLDGQIVYKNEFKAGDPLTIYLVVISVALLIKLVFKKKTPVDILLIPLFGAAVGLILSLLVRYPASYITFGIQWIISKGTEAVPFVMGIVVAVLMGMALTAPISSAAIAAIIFPALAEGQTLADMPIGLLLASGAAIVGCSTQMVGFAVQSKKDNNIGQVISIGIGTSMLQFKNILKKPVIWLPTIITSAILGPISTCWLQLKCWGASAGMGTAGLVGQIGTFSSMGNVWQTYVGIFALQIILPGVLVFLFDLLFRKLGWIKEGDLKL